MQTYSEIKRFVQETLGCTCPEAVFDEINYQKECADISASKINVGDRLLIYVISVDGKTGIQEVINTALEKGVEERNRQGFNRFRLVLATSSPDELRSAAEKSFADSGYANKKTHLHVVSQSDVEGFDSIGA
jgi:hypothetical protein